jgi:hypothetical protein
VVRERLIEGGIIVGGWAAGFLGWLISIDALLSGTGNTRALLGRYTLVAFLAVSLLTLGTSSVLLVRRRAAFMLLFHAGVAAAAAVAIGSHAWLRVSALVLEHRARIFRKRSAATSLFSGRGAILTTLLQSSCHRRGPGGGSNARGQQ